jgi:asparagine synthase (glutamine-hydrolysing)
MKLGILFSGGKDSAYAAYLSKKENYEISCLISIVSKNKESFMFHTPSIEKTKKHSRGNGFTSSYNRKLWA